MKIRVSFVPTSDLADLSALRAEYLAQLELAQEASIELLMPEAAHFRIEAQSGQTIGYCSVHDGDTLIEFHLTPPNWVFGECVFEQLLAKTPVRRALVKSFDRLLFSSCVSLHKSMRTKGLLVRDLVLRELPSMPGLTFATRSAQLADLPAIMAIDQPVFRHPERLHRVVDAGYMQLFENEQGLLGFGIARPIIAGRPEVELGIAVDRPFRLKGYAVYMFRSLIDDCLVRGLVPVAGVAAENIASRSMGERVGMVARHRLLELTF